MYTDSAGSDGNWAAGLSDDGTRPNKVGALSIARSLAAQNPRTWRTAPAFPLARGYYGEPLSWGLFTDDPDADGKVGPFSGVAAWTGEVTQPAPVGRWQHLPAGSGPWALAQANIRIPFGRAMTFGTRLAVVSGTVYLSARLYQADASTAVGGWTDLGVRTTTTRDEGAVHTMTIAPNADAAILRLHIQNRKGDGSNQNAVEFDLAQSTLRVH